MRELDFIEACYAGLPHQGWVEGLCQAFTSLLGVDAPAAGYYYTLDPVAGVVPAEIVSTSGAQDGNPTAMIDNLNRHPQRQHILSHTFRAAPRRAIALSQLPRHVQYDVRREL